LNQVTHLLRLISALQTSLLVWCWQQLSDQDISDKVKATATHIIITCKYVTWLGLNGFPLSISEKEFLGGFSILFLLKEKKKK
jgi:hypothetical protein